MKRPTLRVLEYPHNKTHSWYLDLRPFNNGRKFFKFKAEAEAERLRQIATLIVTEKRPNVKAENGLPAKITCFAKVRQRSVLEDQLERIAAEPQSSKEWLIARERRLRLPVAQRFGVELLVRRLKERSLP